MSKKINKTKTGNVVKSPTVSRRIAQALRTGARELDLSGLGLTSLRESIGNLSQLRTLDLSRNQLTDLPASISQLHDLQILDLSYNQFAELPECIVGLTHLGKLNLQGNQLAGFPESFFRLIELLDLNVSSNRFTDLPDSISQLSELQELNLANNQLSDFPESILQLTRLKNLNFGGNQLRDLPESISNLTQLSILNLMANKLSDLPEAIFHLTELRQLNISNNQLADLSRSISKITKIESLTLSSNSLSQLPDSMSSLKSLSSLEISQNKLTKLPDSLGELTRLSNLNVSYNEIAELPPGVERLTELTTLNFSNNQIAKFPPMIGKLTLLRMLFCDDNNLTELLDLGQLTRLRILSLSGCALRSLPDSVGSLTALRTLYLDHNKLEDLPTALLDLPALKEIFLHGNQGLGLPTEVLGAPWTETLPGEKEAADPRKILEYYFRVKRGGRPINEAKLILVGRGSVGKTSIVNRLVYDTFKDEHKTEGIKISEWKLRLNDSEDVRLNVWDFGGQEIMHATHQFFLTQRSLYLLVLNGREGGEDADADYWLSLIESFGGDSPVILVLNKTGEHPFDLNRRALQQKFPFIRDFIKTDCQHGTGIRELLLAIKRETDRLEDLRKKFPAGWFSIKDQLAAMEDNYLSFQEYRKICERNGEPDSKAQEDLAGFLHRLGVALNYKDDPRVQDTHVLNPHWVTNGIYRVLNSEKLQKQKGEIRLNDLGRALDKSEYPAAMRRFIFDLMKKFELCFSFPEDDTRYLIPELLDKQQPSDADLYDPVDCLNFHYHYPILPEGLVPRFIVRTHTLSEGLPRWRTGVITEFEGCRALVKADLQDKKVFIRVKGPQSSRRRLLAVIRSDFERIHRDIRNLQPREMVPVPDYPDVVVSYEKLLAMEREQIRRFPEYADGKVIEVNVQDLLNGVDLEGEPRREKREVEIRAVRLFISYSHRDDSIRKELESHLKIMQRQGLVQMWSDRRITAGDDWKGQIDKNLENADIILLLISSDFIASDYCYEKEMTRALERETKGEAKLIPVIIRDVSWKTAPFGRLHALPTDGKAVELWEHKDSAWRSVSEGVEEVVRALRVSADVK